MFQEPLIPQCMILVLFCRMLLVALCTIAAGLAAAEPMHGTGRVIPVDEKSWTSAVIESPLPAFALFYSSAHDVPKELWSELDVVAAKFRGMADIVSVDCAVDSTMKKICKASEMVPKVPHMRVYSAHKKRSPYTQQWYKDFQVYDEIPQSRHIAMSLTSQMVDASIKRIRSTQDWDNWVDEHVVPQAC
jgi:hypothetical protein